MIIEELTALVRDEMTKVSGHEFSGIIRYEVHCNKGTIRRTVIIEEPEKQTVEHYSGVAVPRR